MAHRDPGAVAHERAEIFGLDPPRRRPLACAYAALMAFVLTVLAVLLVPELAGAETLVVTNPGNGTGLTLGQAIARANGSAGADTITFGPSAANDTFAMSLPTITDTVTIDGGSSGVTLDFTGVMGDAFTIGADHVALNNLTLFGGSGGGINVSGGGNDTFSHLLVHDFGGPGIVLGGTGSDTVSGTMFGNGADGIDLDSPSNQIQSVVDGFKPDGTFDPNGGVGIFANSSGNVISGSAVGSGGTAIALPNANNSVNGNALKYTRPGLAVDVGAPGRTANTPNAPTNYPIITSANVTAGGTTVSGTVNVAPNSGGIVALYEQSQSGNSGQDVPFTGAEDTYQTGSDGNATWHITTTSVPRQGDTLVVFLTGFGSAGASSSEASDPFDPFGGQGGGGGGGGGGGQGGGGGGGAPPTCPVSPAAQPIHFQFGPGEDANARFVDAAFQVGLGRRATQPELSQLGGLLGSGQLTRLQVAKQVIESPAARSYQVNGLYNQLLGRVPSLSELNAGQMTAQSFGELRVESGLLASTEFFNCSGATNAAFINQLYQDLLRRPVDNTGLNLYGGQLGSGTSRSTVVSEIISTAEALRLFAKSRYTVLLNQQPDSQSLNFYAGLLSTSTEETVEERILSSPLFLSYIGTPPAFSTPALLPNGVIAFNAFEPVNVRLVLYRVMPGHAGDVAAAAAPTLLRAGVVQLGHHRKGRVRVHWNHTLNGHRLRRGRYVVLLQATDRRGRVLYQSDPIKLAIKR